jgi:hypothetical protein
MDGRAIARLQGGSHKRCDRGNMRTRGLEEQKRRAMDTWLSILAIFPNYHRCSLLAQKAQEEPIGRPYPVLLRVSCLCRHRRQQMQMY